MKKHFLAILPAACLLLAGCAAKNEMQTTSPVPEESVTVTAVESADVPGTTVDDLPTVSSVPTSKITPSDTEGTTRPTGKDGGTSAAQKPTTGTSAQQTTKGTTAPNQTSGKKESTSKIQLPAIPLTTKASSTKPSTTKPSPTKPSPTKPSTSAKPSSTSPKESTTGNSHTLPTVEDKYETPVIVNP